MHASMRCKAFIANVLNVLIHGPNLWAIFIRIFRVLHTVQFSRFLLSFPRQLVYYITLSIACQQLFSFSFWTFFSPGCFRNCSWWSSRPVSQGRVLSYHPFRQKSTPFLQSFLNCFNCIYNFQKFINPMSKMHIKAGNISCSRPLSKIINLISSKENP